MGLRTRKITTLISRGLAVMLLVVAQLTPYIILPTSSASAFVPGATCADDAQGANDEPTQKDLTQMCVVQSFDVLQGTTYGIYWAWDDTAWSGANTGDACALLDDDANGFADVAVCVTVSGSPATQDSTSPRYYSCSDTAANKCTSPTAISLPVGATTVCSVTANDPIDPFVGGSSAPLDTSARCVVIASELGLGSSTLLRDVCSYPSQQPNSAPSDCIQYTSKASVEVVKHTVPATDSGRFNLSINGTVHASAVGNNGSTGTVFVDAGSVTIAETASAGSALSNYTTFIECRDQDGLGDVIASGTRTGASSRQLTFDVRAEEEINCTITNTKKTGTLIVTKVLNQDNGGNAGFSDFTFEAASSDGTITQNFEDDGSNSFAVPIGTYTVTEQAAHGYETKYENCSAIVIVEGQTRTCTITNDDIAPQITLHKYVTNDNGGSSVAQDFGIRANDEVLQFDNGSPTSTHTTMYTSQIKGNLASGLVLSEEVTEGYDAGVWICDGIEVGPATEASVVLALGDNITCEITNNDIAPTLTIQKVLIQDNGGTKKVSDFSFAIDGGIATTFETDGTNLVTLDAGEYSITESFTQGYDVTYDNCQAITLQVGDNQTCTITNNDKPAYATITKTFINSFNGGLSLDDFIFSFFDGVTTTPVQSGVAVMLSAGTYTAQEEAEGDVAYIASEWGGDCSATGTVVVALGGQYNCTITNYDEPAYLVVHKTVVNDNGGEKTTDDFMFRVSGLQGDVPFGTDGEVMVVLDGMTHYDVTESYEGSDYAATYDGCSFYAVNGETYHCYITNNDVPPVLTVIKESFPCTSERIFPVTIAHSTLDPVTVSLSGRSCYRDSEVPHNIVTTDAAFQAGLVTVTESVPEGWVQDYMVCYDQNEAIIDTSTQPILLQNGGRYTCRFANTQLSEVIVEKYHDINEDGEWDENEPSLSGWDMTLTPEYYCDEAGRSALVSLVLIGNGDEDGDCEVTTTVATTDSEGSAYFQEVYPGYYSANEVLKKGWVQSSIRCYGSEEQIFEERESEARILDESMYEEVSDFFYVGPGAGARCEIGNYRTPQVQITKSNNTTGPVLPGTEIQFTLIVTVPDSATSGLLQGANSGSSYVPVLVTDFLTNEFSYVAGSATATSSVRGNLMGSGITSDPRYASPGTWRLTNEVSNSIAHNEVITLTYRARVGSSTPAGVYPTVATVKGYGDSQFVTATATDDDKVTVMVPAVLAATTPVTLQPTGASAYASIIGLVVICAALLLRSRENVA